MIADGKTRIMVTMDKRVVAALDQLAKGRKWHRCRVLDDAIADYLESVQRSGTFDEARAVTEALSRQT